jgi:hypothetical protein
MADPKIIVIDYADGRYYYRSLEGHMDDEYNQNRIIHLSFEEESELKVLEALDDKWQRKFLDVDNKACIKERSGMSDDY